MGTPVVAILRMTYVPKNNKTKRLTRQEAGDKIRTTRTDLSEEEKKKKKERNEEVGGEGGGDDVGEGITNHSLK